MKLSQTIDEMTDREVLDAMNADTPLARVRTIFSRCSAEIEQAGMQRRSLTPIEMRRLELQAANNILELFGIALS